MSSALDIAYEQLRDMAITKNFTPASLITLLMAVMQVVEKVTQGTEIKGDAKREMAIELVKKLVGEIAMSDKDKAAVQTAIDSFLPEMIDGFVKIDHEKLFHDTVSAVAQFIDWCKKNCTCCLHHQN